MVSSTVWIVAGIALGLAAAGALVWWAVDGPPEAAGASAASPTPSGHGAMSPEEMCRHMPEHCGNSTREAA